MNDEEWRQLAPNYEVSSLGRVRRSTPGRRTFAGRILKQQAQECGYFSVRPTVDGENTFFYVHDLVAAAFVGPKPDGAIVNHIDTDKHNNRAGNIEYTTHAGNMKHAADNGLMARGEAHPGSKLTADTVRQLRLDRGAGLSFSRLATKHGVSIATAFGVVHRTQWKHVA
jgi:hypothetical protein